MLTILLEFLRPHGWIALAAMLLANGAICYRFGGRALFFTIPLVAIVYGVLDVAWIRSEMAKPGWDGQPDQDGIFVLGMMLRCAVAAILLFASFAVAVLLSNAIPTRKNPMQSEDRG